MQAIVLEGFLLRRCEALRVVPRSVRDARRKSCGRKLARCGWDTSTPGIL